MDALIGLRIRSSQAALERRLVQSLMFFQTAYLNGQQNFCLPLEYGINRVVFLAFFVAWTLFDLCFFLWTYHRSYVAFSAKVIVIVIVVVLLFYFLEKLLHDVVVCT